MTTLAAFTALLLFGAQPPAPSGPVMLWPGDRAVLHEREGALVLRGEGLSPTEIAVTIQGAPITSGAIHIGGKYGGFLHVHGDLSPGLNTVVVLVKGKKAAECLVFLPDPLEGLSEAPPGFSPRDFHVRQTEALCGGCHFKKGAEECATCHSGLGAHKVVHIPVLGGQCDLCHGHVKTEPSRFALLSHPPGQCLQCHENVKETLAKNSFRHGPASAGACTVCHSPHSSDFVFLLRRKPFDLCTSCHVEKKEGRHMISGFTFGESHPIGAPAEARREDPTRPGQDFSCISCHDPHASPVPQMWKFEAKERFWFCQSCHKK